MRWTKKCNSLSDGRSVLFLLAAVTVLTAFAVVWHHRRQRVTAITLQLNLQRLDFDLQRLAERPAAAAAPKLASRCLAAADKLTVLEPHMLPPPPPDAGAFTTWHALAPDGGCPAPIPAWDWRTFLRAAQATSARERQEALGALHAASRVPEGQLMRLAQSYDAKLRAREFVGILDAPHPPCGGRAVARGGGDRLRRRDCPDGYGRYALDDHAELREYTGPCASATPRPSSPTAAARRGCCWRTQSLTRRSSRARAPRCRRRRRRRGRRRCSC